MGWEQNEGCTGAAQYGGSVNIMQHQEDEGPEKSACTYYGIERFDVDIPIKLTMTYKLNTADNGLMVSLSAKHDRAQATQKPAEANRCSGTIRIPRGISNNFTD